ncbi:MAG TPA: PilZ domain-containing protein [Sphingomonadaceae bacterium]|nr:PilZ domain-containing protein [Sphingomonadaceae bacterium]
MAAQTSKLQELLNGFGVSGDEDRRGAPRFALLMQGAKLASEFGEILCVVRDASSDGVSIRHYGHLPDCEQFTFELANGENFPVSLVWRDEQHAGLKFPDEVDTGRLVKLASGHYPRRQLRVNTMLEGSVRAGDETHVITVRNISQQGACIECRDYLEVGETVTVETETLEPVSARVRWCLSTIYGLVFDEPLDCEQLAAIVADARRH